MIARSCAAVASLFTLLVLAPGPASAQRLDEQVAAWTGEIAAKAAVAVAGRLATDDLIVKAINRAADRDVQFDRLLALLTPCNDPERDRCGDPETTSDVKTGKGQDVAGWKKLILSEGAKYLLMPEIIDGLWAAKKKIVVDTVNGLAPEKKARIVKTLEATMDAVLLYASDTDGIRQAFMDRRAADDLWHQDASLKSRAREAQERLSAKMEKLALDPDKLNLADRLWWAGGKPLLAATLRVGSSLQQEIKPKDKQIATGRY